MAKPKLALIPAAQGDKFYSVLPSDGVGDFDFTRNSSATRIAPTGFIETSELFGSELVTNGDFATDSDWTKGTGWSIANGVASLDGTQTTGSGLGSTTISVVSGKRYKIVVNVLSSSSGFRLYDSYGVIAYGLSLGVNVFYITASSSTYQITPLGLSGTTGSIDNVSVKEQIGKSRLNYDLLNGKVVNCPHYLLEPASTNLFTYSQDFSNSYWSKVGGSISADAITSPNGSLDADKFTEDSSNGLHAIFQNAGVAIPTGNNTLSIFVKSNGRNFFQIRTGSAGGVDNSPLYANFDLINNTETASSTGVINSKVEIYPNNWKKISITFNVSSSAVVALVFQTILSGTSVMSESYQGDETSSFYLFGATIENLSYPTSYIPTNGTAITRAAETANGSGDAATFNDSEGVLMLETSALANDGTSKRVSISDGTYSNRIVFDFSSATNTINGFVISQGANVYSPSEVVNDITQPNKFAIKYKQNDFSFFINGFKFDVDTNGNIPSGLNILQFAEGDGAASPFYGKTREVQYFDSALTDAQLETLTSWTSLQEMITSQLYTNY